MRSGCISPYASYIIYINISNVYENPRIILRLIDISETVIWAKILASSARIMARFARESQNRDSRVLLSWKTVILSFWCSLSPISNRKSKYLLNLFRAVWIVGTMGISVWGSKTGAKIPHCILHFKLWCIDGENTLHFTQNLPEYLPDVLIGGRHLLPEREQ